MKKALGFTIAAGAIVIASAFTGISQHKKPVAAAAASSVTAPAAAKWTIDKAHSTVKFSVKHMVVSEVEGSFKSFDGTLEHDKPDYSDGKVTFTIEVNSLSTDNENRDKHLKSDDFFNAEKYPTIKFESTSFTPQGGSKYKLTGNLTIRDVTRPVTLDVVYGGVITSQGKTKTGFKATTTINRFDYNLKWDKATETGGMVVGKEVEITVKAELNKAS